MRGELQWQSIFAKYLGVTVDFVEHGSLFSILEMQIIANQPMT
jgi:hypothetical protein